jgi:hypothetical protein
MTSKFRKLAYGKPKNIKGAGKVINAGSRIGTRLIQITALRPEIWGYDKARGKKK